ncbi:MAG: hypothetical protein ACRDRG_03825 [Pseudonocardiaceae bacterium]
MITAPPIEVKPPPSTGWLNAFPNAVMVHTPVHASWLNQVEVYFSVTQRKVVSPNDFTTPDQVEQRLAKFEQRYNATARPFQWKFHPNRPRRPPGQDRPAPAAHRSKYQHPGRVINPRRTSDADH